MHASEALLDYLQALIAATRQGAGSSKGSPRAGIAAAARRQGACADQPARLRRPDDVQAVLPQTVAHRLCRWAAPAAAASSRCAHDRRGAGAVNPRQQRPRLGRTRCRALRSRRVRLAGGRLAPAAPTRCCSANATSTSCRRRPGWCSRLTLVVLLLALDQLPAQPRLRADLPAGRRGAVSMHVTHGTLRGSRCGTRPAPVFAGEPARCSRSCSPARRRARFGIGLAGRRAGRRRAPGSTCRRKARRARGSVCAGVRGCTPCRAEHRDPLPARSVPRLGDLAPAMRSCSFTRRPSALQRRCRRHARWPVWAGAARRSGEMDGVRSLPRGDPLKLVYWKRPPRPGQRRRTGQPRHRRRGQPAALAGLAVAPRWRRGAWSRLSAWVLAARRLLVGLVLPAPASTRARQANGAHCWRRWRCGADLPRPGWPAAAWPGWSRTCRARPRYAVLLGVIGWTVLPHVPSGLVHRADRADAAGALRWPSATAAAGPLAAGGGARRSPPG